jgi:hypothetical protein
VTPVDLPNTTHAMDIGTKIIIWPPIFMVRSCTVFPLRVWTDIIFKVFASAVIGGSNADAVSKESESLMRTRIFTSLVTSPSTGMK